MTLQKLEKLKFLILIVGLIGIIVLVKTFNLGKFFSPSILKETILGYGIMAPIIFIILYILATIFFIPGTPLTISGGLIFGKFVGTFYTIIGATIGATIAFSMSRYLGESFIEKLLKDKYKKLYQYDEKIKTNGLAVVLFLRLIPLFPFNGLNFALGLTKLKRRDFIIGTAIGIIPGSFALAFLGDSLANFSIWKIILASLLFVSLMAIPFIYKKLKSKKSKIN